MQRVTFPALAFGVANAPSAGHVARAGIGPSTRGPSLRRAILDRPLTVSWRKHRRGNRLLTCRWVMRCRQISARVGARVAPTTTAGSRSSFKTATEHRTPCGSPRCATSTHHCVLSHRGARTFPPSNRSGPHSLRLGAAQNRANDGQRSTLKKPTIASPPTPSDIPIG